MNQEELKELIHYDPATGVFTWLIAPCKNIKDGAEAGNLRPDGYRAISYDGKRYYAHRLAFLYMDGEVPEMVDHINRNPSDNSWNNLRPTNHSENGINADMRKSKSGHRGITFEARTGRYCVMIWRNNARKSLGTYDTIIEAVGARLRAERAAP